MIALAACHSIDCKKPSRDVAFATRASWRSNFVNRLLPGSGTFGCSGSAGARPGVIPNEGKPAHQQRPPSRERQGEDQHQDGAEPEPGEEGQARGHAHGCWNGCLQASMRWAKYACTERTN